MRVFRAYGAGSAGSMRVEASADVGDATMTAIELSDGQWPGLTVTEIPRGWRIEFCGIYEREELLEFLDQVREALRTEEPAWVSDFSDSEVRHG